MAITAPGTTQGTVTPDRKAAQGGASTGEDRPGFDLGGAKDSMTGVGSPPGSQIIPGGPLDPVSTSNDLGRGTAPAHPDGGVGVGPGGPAAGGRSGEVDTAADGLRPPQGLDADRADPPKSTSA